MHQAPGRAAELSMKAVAARKRTAEQAREQVAEIPVPTSPEDIFRGLATIFAQLSSGKIPIAVARTMANVAHPMLKAWELTQAQKMQNAASQFENGIDPADLSLEEWEKIYGQHLMKLGGHVS